MQLIIDNESLRPLAELSFYSLHRRNWTLDESWLTAVTFGMVTMYGSLGVYELFRHPQKYNYIRSAPRKIYEMEY